MTLSPRAATAGPVTLSVGLIAFGFLEGVRDHSTFQLSFVGAGALLLIWSGVLFGRARSTRRRLTLQISLRSQHYVQALAQSTFLLYWGWHWRPVYDSGVLILAQLVFAYAFDMLLVWSRRDTYVLGFGPFPIIFSINLFLWFRDDWFYLQFLLVGLGFAAKELLRWERDGRQVHVFNPSSFPLAVFSLALIVTGTSDLTWGQDIATTQFFPPHVYLVVFLVAVPGQFLFGVTSMTMSAVAVTYLFGVLYFRATGVYFFYDSYIPIAVFLGMHLLITDPSTAPRTGLGRVMFGTLYGLSTVALYALLFEAGVPAFYDKLLPVPLLNLAVRRLDTVTASIRLPAHVTSGVTARVRSPRHLALAMWVCLFVALSAVQGVGDEHPGQWTPFWRKACAEGRPHACAYLLNVHLRSCRAGSGWACNESGLLQMSRDTGIEGAPRPFDATQSFARGCELGDGPACRNLTATRNDLAPIERAPPTLSDYAIVLRGTKGPLTTRAPAALLERACAQGWTEACDRSIDDGGV